MTETRSHKRAKDKAAGKTEVRIKGKRRIDSMSLKRATEVERSGSLANLKKAAMRLKASGKSQKVLIVPNTDMAKAKDAMKKVGTSGTVKNMTGTRKSFVPKEK